MKSFEQVLKNDERAIYSLRSLYKKYGYSLYKVSRFEEYDLYAKNKNFLVSRNILSFTDTNGNLLALKPDVISFLIGINDVWHRHGPEAIATSDEQIELNYREILKRIKRETNAKIIILSPYLLDAEITQYMKGDLVTVLPIVKRLADIKDII